MPSTEAAAIGMGRSVAASSAQNTRAAQHFGVVDALLAALRLGLLNRQGPGSEADAAALAQVADWGAVAALARRHQVSCLLLQGLRAQGAVLAASGVESLLKEQRDRVVRRCLRQLDGLRQALNCLAEGDIPCLVLKGLPLSQRLCGNALLRDAVDIDLLVSPQSFHAAERRLLQCGWRKVSEFRETPVRNRWHSRFVADSRFTGPGGTLELHHRFFDNPHYFNAEFERLSARAASVAIGNVSFPTMHEDDDLLYLMCHGAKHRWANLKWLCDIAMIFANMPPPRLEQVAAHCREARLAPVLTSTLQLCRDALHIEAGPLAGAPQTPSLLPIGKRPAFPINELKRTWGGWDARTRFRRQFSTILLLRPNLGALLHGLATILTTPRDWRRIDLPDQLFPFYVLLRPFLWLEAELKGLFAKNRSLRPSAKGCS